MTVTETLGGTIMLALQIRVQDGSLLCGRSGGHIRGMPGDRIQWASDQAFTLEFFRLAEETAESAGAAPREGSSLRWPFSEPAEPRDVQWPVQRFEGMLREGYGVYKYYVTIGNLRLDPIVIIDR